MIKAGIFPPFTSARNRATIATTKTKKSERKKKLSRLLFLSRNGYRPRRISSYFPLQISPQGWFSAKLKLQQGDAKAVENETGFIATEDKRFNFSVALDEDFKITKDKDTQKEVIEIKLHGA